MSETKDPKPQEQLPEARLISELDPDRPNRAEAEASDAGDAKRTIGGSLAWMARNSVAANILMAVLLIGGAVQACLIKQEVFPEFDLDLIVVNIPYPGASPEEVEQGVVLIVEESIRDIDGIKRITSTAGEGLSVSTVELLRGADPDQALNDIKAAVDRITSFPENIERPNVFMPRIQNQVTSLIIYGDQEEAVLKDLAEQMREDLLQDPRITVVEIGGVKPLEISIEVSQEDLRRYNLTIEQIATAVKLASIELPGGAVKTDKGEVLVRTAERRDVGYEFENIELLARPDGTRLYLSDIATVKDGFAETDQLTLYNGEPAVLVNVFRVGDQTPIEISEATRAYMKQRQQNLPPGVQLAEWLNNADLYKDRRDLLFRNAALGLALVLLILGIFLEVRLAFWVTLGIPISFVGALLFLPSTDVSINMLSLFAFILVLGMVVDDAIIVGESIYRWQQEGLSRIEAAIRGVREVATPVTFAIITTIIAYMPMLFVPGVMGKFFRVIPVVVIICLIMSLVESLLILPAHLANSKPSQRGIFGLIHRSQQSFSRMLERHIQRFYVPAVAAAVRRRYLTLCACIAVLLAVFGLFAGGRVESEFFPGVDADVVLVEAEMPFGTPIEVTAQVQKRILDAANEVMETYGGAENISRGLFSNLGIVGTLNRAPGQIPPTGSHLAEVALYMVPIDQRSFKSIDFERAWREKVGDIPGIDQLSFRSSTGPGTGAPINIELSHPDLDRLQNAAADLAARLTEFSGTYQIEDGFSDGKEQLDIELTPEARALGLTETDLARQIRSAFFGAEAVRQQRGRDELRVYVRLPRVERESEFNIEELIIRTPQGGEIPLAQAARVERGQSYTSITRINGRRAVSVTSEVDTTQANADRIVAQLQSQVLPDFLTQHPGVSYELGGDTLDQRETIGSLQTGGGLAILIIYALLAIVFRSYLQPLIVMSAIPFGVVGAIIGHLIMGYKMSLMSTLGIVALSGVVVNDSLILIVAVNRLRERGMPLIDAVVAGGAVRFRPIILTSLTTFFGLAPMILETSVQARFLIPMALSLGFGIIFATAITLLLVPAGYMIVETSKERVSRWWRWVWGADSDDSKRPTPAP